MLDIPDKPANAFGRLMIPCKEMSNDHEHCSKILEV